MEDLYALGVNTIEIVQYGFKDFEGYLELINTLAAPNLITEWVFPCLAVFDSVFAAQLILCLAFGNWVNYIMKWWMLEDRPYWWIRETSYYNDSVRPKLRQHYQTCETGPGSPSGHCNAFGIAMTLACMFIAHVVHDRKWKVPFWVNNFIYPVFGFSILSVIIARMYIAAHFPHQCLLGTITGLFTAPALCIYVCDPFLWRYGFHSNYPVSKAVKWHVFSSLMAVFIAFLTYLGLRIRKIDPFGSIKSAFRWCQNVDNIHLSSSPMYSLVQCTGYLLGWAISVTPAVTQYRHDTKNRSLIISIFSTVFVIYVFRQINEQICKSNTLNYYISQFVMFSLKPTLYLRVIPYLSMWPFKKIKAD